MIYTTNNIEIHYILDDSKTRWILIITVAHNDNDASIQEGEKYSNYS